MGSEHESIVDSGFKIFSFAHAVQKFNLCCHNDLSLGITKKWRFAYHYDIVNPQEGCAQAAIELIFSKLP